MRHVCNASDWEGLGADPALGMALGSEVYMVHRLELVCKRHVMWVILSSTATMEALYPPFPSVL